MTSHHSDGENASVRHTRLAVLDRAVQRLEDADRTAPRRTAEWILIDVLNCNRAQLYAHPNQRVSSEDVDNFLEMITRRVRGEPLQHILGYASFYGLELEVSPGVMIPRPETEEVVDRALGCLQNIDRPRVLDVGTGSGCIALALKQERPDSTVYACDVSREALDVARANADALQSDVRFVHGDVTAADSSEHMPSELDLLVSNPPYIPTSEAESLPAVVRDYDPEIALFTGDDPLRFYRVLSERALTLCVPGGAFVVEVHTDYFEEVTTLLRQKGLVDIDVDADMNDRPRVVWGFIPGAANE